MPKMSRLQNYLVISMMYLICTQALAFDLHYVASSGQQYAHPHDIVLSADRRYLYVADNNNHRIAVLEPDSLKFIGSFGEGLLSEPHDVIFDPAGQLLVADTGNSRIAIFAVRGATARLTGELRGAISRPEGVAVHGNGRIYVTGAASDNIEVFARGVSIAVAGGLSSPHDVSVAADGSLWIADAGNDRLVNMSEDLQVLRILQGAPYHFNGPRYLDFDPAGRLFVADKYNHQIKVLAPDHFLLLTLGDGRSGLGAGKFNRPEGVTIHGEAVWFSDTYNDRIVRYRIAQ